MVQRVSQALARRNGAVVRALAAWPLSAAASRARSIDAPARTLTTTNTI